MKSLLVSALALVSLSAFAGTVGDFPKVQFGSVFVSVENVCVAGDVIKTKQPVAVCVAWSAGEASCSATVSKVLSTPISYTKEFATGEGSFQTITMSIPLEYDVTYGTMTEGGVVGHTEKYSIGGCEN